MPEITFFTFFISKVSQIDLEMESAHKIWLINAILVKSETMKFLTYLVKLENFKWAGVLFVEGVALNLGGVLQVGQNYTTIPKLEMI